MKIRLWYKYLHEIKHFAVEIENYAEDKLFMLIVVRVKEVWQHEKK